MSKKNPRKGRKLTNGEKYVRHVMSGKSKSKAMQLIGKGNSSPTHYERTQEVVEAKKALVEQMGAAGITDSLILERLYMMLTKKEKALSFGQVIEIDEVDTKSAKAALELILRLKEKQEEKQADTSPLQDLSIAELIEQTNQAERDRLYGGEESLEHLKNSAEGTDRAEK
jgi:hypothetical protein